MENVATLEKQINALGIELLIRNLPEFLQSLLVECCTVKVDNTTLIIDVLTDSKDPPLTAVELAESLFDCQECIFKGGDPYFNLGLVRVHLCGTPFHQFSAKGLIVSSGKHLMQNNGTITVLDSLSDIDLRDLDSLIDWMRLQTVPLSLTPNDTNATYYVNRSYAEFTDRSQAQWAGDQNNVYRFPAGELGRIIKSLKSATNRLITDFQFTADVWNMPNLPHFWYGDAKEIIIDGRSYRLLHTKHREQCSIMI